MPSWSRSFALIPVSFRTRWMRTRFPFKYGIAAMTELPHVFVVVEGSLGGVSWRGLASEGLPPKWFSKNPDTRFEEDLPEMLECIEHAAGLVKETTSESVFAAWRALYDAQAQWAKERGVPPLLAHLGTALIERALIDGFCRGAGVSFAEAVRTNALGVDLGSLHGSWRERRRSTGCRRPGGPSLHGTPWGWEILCGRRISRWTNVSRTGLPHALRDAVQSYGLTHFKIKVCGNLEADVPRLREVAAVLSETSPGFRYTLDGNEQYRDIATFREHWEAYRSAPGLEVLFEAGRLLFVEQPLHRDVALAGSVGGELAAWADAPPMIIDESDGELDCMRRAIALGYQGTSHKNCKGVIKGLANRCLIEWYRQENPEGGPWLMSGGGSCQRRAGRPAQRPRCDGSPRKLRTWSAMDTITLRG